MSNIVWEGFDKCEVIPDRQGPTKLKLVFCKDYEIFSLLNICFITRWLVVIILKWRLTLLLQFGWSLDWHRLASFRPAKPPWPGDSRYATDSPPPLMVHPWPGDSRYATDSPALREVSFFIGRGAFGKFFKFCEFLVIPPTV